MTNLRTETRRLSLAFVVSGSATLALGVLALALPEQTLIAGMLTVGLIAVLAGLNQILTAVSIRSRAPNWRLLLMHGLLSLTFGLLTVGATALSLSVLLGAIALWLAVRSVLAARLAFEAASRRVRWALWASATLDLCIAIGLVVLPAVSIFQYLFFGAVYAVVFGASQLVAGLALRHMRLDHPHPPTLHVSDWYGAHSHHQQTSAVE